MKLSEDCRYGLWSIACVMGVEFLFARGAVRAWGDDLDNILCEAYVLKQTSG